MKGNADLRSDFGVCVMLCRSLAAPFESGFENVCPLPGRHFKKKVGL